jgi:hypothetical protein
VEEMVIGKLDLPKRQANTEIMCVEPAQMHFEILLIQVEFPELWNIRTFATIREESGSRTRSPGTSSVSVPLSLVNIMMNNAGAARDQALETTLY